MRTPSILIISLLSFILSCSTETQYSQSGVGGTGNIALSGDDESGIGGTGAPVSNSGVGGTGKQVASGVGGTGKRDGMGGTGHQGLGGTGQIAKTSGVGGTGIIGEVTGFGSIFVNGFEVEIVEDSEIRSNNKLNNSIKPGIGDIVEILAHRVGDETHAKKLNIRHEIVGPVETVNLKRRSFTIIGQTIVLNNSKSHLPKAGDMIAVSGLRDQQGVIHATRVSFTKSKSVWLIDKISNNKSNTLKLGRSYIQTEHANYYRIGDIIRVRASYRNGQLFADEIFSNNAFEKQVSHLILQGFIREGNRNNYKIGNIQFSTRSARIRTQLKQNQGRWTRVEVSRNSVGLWEVEHLIDNSNLIRGSLTPQHSSIKTQQMFDRGSNSKSSIHDRFNKPLHETPAFPMTNPHSPYNGGTAKSPGAPKKPNNSMPQMPNFPSGSGPSGMPAPAAGGGMGSGSKSNKKSRNMPSRSGGMM